MLDNTFALGLQGFFGDGELKDDHLFLNIV